MAASLFIGLLIMILLFLNFFESDPPHLVKVLFFPVKGIVSLIPFHNIGTSENPVYEGTPVHLLAAFGGVILCFPFYGALSYVFFFIIDFTLQKIKN